MADLRRHPTGIASIASLSLRRAEAVSSQVPTELLTVSPKAQRRRLAEDMLASHLSASPKAPWRQFEGQTPRKRLAVFPKVQRTGLGGQIRRKHLAAFPKVQQRAFVEHTLMRHLAAIPKARRREGVEHIQIGRLRVHPELQRNILGDRLEVGGERAAERTSLEERKACSSGASSAENCSTHSRPKLMSTAPAPQETGCWEEDTAQARRTDQRQQSQGLAACCADQSALSQQQLWPCSQHAIQPWWECRRTPG